MRGKKICRDYWLNWHLLYYCVVARLLVGLAHTSSPLDLRVFHCWWSDVHVPYPNSALLCGSHHVLNFTLGHDPRSSVWTLRFTRWHFCCTLTRHLCHYYLSSFFISALGRRSNGVIICILINKSTFLSNYKTTWLALVLQLILY